MFVYVFVECNRTRLTNEQSTFWAITVAIHFQQESGPSVSECVCVSFCRFNCLMKLLMKLECVLRMQNDTWCANKIYKHLFSFDERDGARGRERAGESTERMHI